MREVINIGLAGFGTVGSGAVKILIQNEEAIARKLGTRLVVKRIADLDITTPRQIEVDRSILTTNVREILNDPEIDIFVETIGGLKPAGDFVREALKNGKHVVTANKELIAKEGASILPLAAELKRDIMFEASVGGGIPIIRPLKACLAGNEITEIKGVVNGTTNYILTRMRDDGLSFDAALKEAQQKGYAETPDPSADTEGHDAAYKIAILASIAFTSRIDVSKVYREGIGRISAADIKYAKELGFTIKLLAIAKQIGQAVLVRVHPAFVPVSHPIASVNGVFNGIYVKGDAVGEVMFYGPGAGSLAAGSAVVGDIIDVARNIIHDCNSRIACTCTDNREMLDMASVTGRNYVRILAEDKPRVLAAIANEFANAGVSIESVLQRLLPDGAAEIVWLTHEAAEPNVRAALEAIKGLPVVKEIGSWVRVEE